MPEEDLLSRLIEGNPQAYTELVRRFAPLVYGICYKFLLNREDAEDVSQEVFAEVARSVSQFRGESQLSTWIGRIAVHRSMDELKKRKRKKHLPWSLAIALLPHISGCHS